MPIIDFRVRPRTAYFFKDLVPTVIPAYRTYVEMFHIQPRLQLTSLRESIEEMAAAGVTHGVIFAGSARGNREVNQACREFPDHYYGLAGIDISAGVTQGVRDLEQAYGEYDLKGLSLSSFMTGIAADDSRYYPLYAATEKAGRMVQIHAAAHFNPTLPYEISDPAHVDRVAIDFPGLRIVMCHAGYGFGTRGLSVALKHANVYVDLTGLHPRALPVEYLHFINGPLRDKALFGTNFPCLTFDIVDEWKKAVRPENHERFFHLNAARVLGIGG